jgi:hypothetical protein
VKPAKGKGAERVKRVVVAATAEKGSLWGVYSPPARAVFPLQTERDK